MTATNIKILFLGIANSIGMLSCVVMTPFANKSITLVGDVNMVLLSNLVIGSSLMAYAFIA